MGFVRRVVALRQAHPSLRQARFLHGRHRDAAGLEDVTWLAADGREMAEAAWRNPANRCLGLRLAGEGETLLLLLNAQGHAVPFALPPAGAGKAWVALLETAAPEAGERRVTGGRLALPATSLALLQATPG
jgi:glycogen operon protein